MKSYIQFFNVKMYQSGGNVFNSDAYKKLSPELQEEWKRLKEDGALDLEFNLFLVSNSNKDNVAENVKWVLDNVKGSGQVGSADGITADQQASNVLSTSARLASSSLKGGVMSTLIEAGDKINKTGANIAIQGVKALDQSLMGDKNFGKQSEAIDAGVHGVSSALMKSKNPYAIGAAVALEVGNFATKATGQTVDGFDVGVNSSGYGNIGHYESKSNRDFGALIGLGGLNQGSINKQLQKRNEAAAMALKAASVADEQNFQKEARLNSVDDVIRSNEVALQGGIDTSLLAAKKGAKLLRFEEYKKFLQKSKQEIPKAQNGAKLEKIELSDEVNVIPEGSLHRNKHHLDIEGITEKGIPVVTVNDDDVETFEEIKEQEESIKQHAEVEHNELTMNLELTQFIEEKRKEYHDSNDENDDICLEVGMRFVKELMYNTDDNTQLIDKIEEHEQNNN